jgi:hypothetical protein
VADLLVRSEIIGRADRDLEGITDAGALVTGMARTLADMGASLADLAEAPAGLAARMVDAHARLMTFLHGYAFGPDPGELR